MWPFPTLCVSTPEEGEYFLKVLIPSYAAGSIIGKGGQTIVQLQKETGATIKLSKSKDFYPGKNEHWVIKIDEHKRSDINERSHQMYRPTEWVILWWKTASDISYSFAFPWIIAFHSKHTPIIKRLSYLFLCPWETKHACRCCIQVCRQFQFQLGCLPSRLYPSLQGLFFLSVHGSMWVQNKNRVTFLEKLHWAAILFPPK